LPTEAESTDPTTVQPWPAWVRALGAAAWVCDSSGRLAFVNSRARALLGLATDPAGAPCHRVIRGTDAAGTPLCRADCAVRRAAAQGRELEPLVLRTGEGGAHRRWLLVFQIPVARREPGRWIVHVACDVEHYRRAEEYVQRLASRSGTCERPCSTQVLTERELEVLDRLARDEPAKRIAFQLRLSPATVRNHIRNLLAKLEVHSIHEAIAVYLLDGTDARGRARS
jgi:DNA-binding CsgD family transcriptional regulator